MSALAEHLSRKGITAVAVAGRLGVAHTTVIRWAAGRVPAERVRDVSRVTGLTLHELRPDLYDPPQSAAPASAPEAA